MSTSKASHLVSHSHTCTPALSVSSSSTFTTLQYVFVLVCMPIDVHPVLSIVSPCRISHEPATTCPYPCTSTRGHPPPMVCSPKESPWRAMHAHVHACSTPTTTAVVGGGCSPGGMLIYPYTNIHISVSRIRYKSIQIHAHIHEMVECTTKKLP